MGVVIRFSIKWAFHTVSCFSISSPIVWSSQILNYVDHHTLHSAYCLMNFCTLYAGNKQAQCAADIRILSIRVVIQC